MKEVAVYQLEDHHRSGVICSALMKGIRAAGDRPILIPEPHYIRKPVAPVAVFYGLERNLRHVLNDYSEVGKAVYVDLGYWGRRDGGRWSGYHKLCVNARHPTTYFQARTHDDRRARALGIKAKPWRSGDHILIAGMGDKGARADGFEPEQWERETINELRRHTNRRIIYRPKPSWKRARPIPGVGFSPKVQEIESVLASCHAVVTHHSNVAVDGLVAGIPAFCWSGVASLLASQDLSKIETPLYPDGREQFINDLAYTQWSIAEMAVGLPWRHLKDEGLIP